MRMFTGHLKAGATVVFSIGHTSITAVRSVRRASAFVIGLGGFSGVFEDRILLFIYL